VIYAVLAALGAGVALGAWVTWLVMRAPALAAAGSPSDPAVVAAIATAGAPAQNAAREAAAEVLHASDDELDARARELLERGQSGK
jgi:hypothetical protein